MSSAPTKTYLLNLFEQHPCKKVVHRLQVGVDLARQNFKLDPRPPVLLEEQLPVL
jgi:hypothetical protein